MNPVQWKYASLILLLVSAAFLVGTLTLPQVRSPQEAIFHGPAVTYGNGTDALSGYYIPTVEKGSQVNITFSNFIPGKVEISVFVTQEGGIAPVPGITPVYVGTLVTNTTLTTPKAAEAQPYGIYVISYNGTTFVVRVRAVYSTYYWLAAYTALATMAAFVFGILFYYYTFTARRWRRDQEAIGDATGESRQFVPTRNLAGWGPPPCPLRSIRPAVAP